MWSEGSAQAGCAVAARLSEDPGVYEVLIEEGDENQYERSHYSIGAHAMFETEANKGDSKMASIPQRMTNHTLPAWFGDDFGPLYAVPPLQRMRRHHFRAGHIRTSTSFIAETGLLYPNPVSPTSFFPRKRPPG
jgi:hypothetical protein